MPIHFESQAAARAGLTELDMMRLSAASDGRELPPPSPHVQRQIRQIRAARARRAASSTASLSATATETAVRRYLALHAELYPTKKRPD